MDLGASSSSKAEPFLLMAKAVKGAAAAKLIQDVTAAPAVFVFSELLELPNIQELGQQEQFAKSLALLQLFSYKTYQDYVRNQEAFGPLNNAQITKLKHLSIVSLASEQRILRYDHLMKSLDMPTVRDLEDLIIDAIYLDILQGKLDQKEEQLEIEYTMGRDTGPGELESILAALQTWASTTSAVLSTLDDKISSVALEASRAKAKQLKHDEVLKANLKQAFERQKEKSLGGGGGANWRAFGGHLEKDNMQMDVDIDPSEHPKAKNRKGETISGSKPVKKRNKF